MDYTENTDFVKVSGMKEGSIRLVDADIPDVFQYSLRSLLHVEDGYILAVRLTTPGPQSLNLSYRAVEGREIVSYFYNSVVTNLFLSISGSIEQNDTIHVPLVTPLFGK